MDTTSWLLLEHEDPHYRLDAAVRMRDALGGRDVGWVEQMQPFLRHFTRPGDTVLDPFAGFGTTLLAAHLEDRRSIGIELDPARAALARQRLQRHGAHDAEVRVGDVRALADSLPPIAACLTSVPYFGARPDPAAAPQQLYGQAHYQTYLEQLHEIFRAVRSVLVPGGRVIAFAENLCLDGRFVPLAWDLARVLDGLFELREERVLLYRKPAETLAPGEWRSNRSHEYAFVADTAHAPLDIPAALALLEALTAAGHRLSLRGSLRRWREGDRARVPVDMDLHLPFDPAALHGVLAFLAERGFALRCWQQPLTLPADLAALRPRRYVRAQRLDADGRGLRVDVGWD
jgi:hypothetical protein